MGRCNIQNRKTGLWRCWSTIVDDWITDWMTEEEYKNWIIQETVEQLTAELEEYGIREARYITAACCNYKKALQKHCEDLCKDDPDKDCDNCKYNVSFDYYRANGLDYLNIDLDE